MPINSPPLFTRVGPPPPPPAPTKDARRRTAATPGLSGGGGYNPSNATRPPRSNPAANAQTTAASRAEATKYRNTTSAPPPPGKPQAPAGQIAMSEENDQMIQPSSTRVTPSPGNKILQDLRQSARQRDRHPALPAKGHAEGTGDGSNLQGPSGAKYSEGDISRPAWQYLPDHDSGDEPSRSDYRNAGFRMLLRQPVDIRS